MYIHKLKEAFYSIIIQQPEVFQFVMQNGSAGFLIIDPLKPADYWINPLLAFELAAEGNIQHKIDITAIFSQTQLKQLIEAKAEVNCSESEKHEEVFTINVTTGTAQVSKSFKVHRLPICTAEGDSLLIIAFNRNNFKLSDHKPVTAISHHYLNPENPNTTTGLSHLIQDLEKQSLADLLTLALSNSSDGVMVNVKGEVIYVSPAFTRITGYLVDDLNAMGPAGMFELIHIDDKAAHEIAIFKALKELKKAMTTRFRFLTKEGKYIWVENANFYHYDGSECVGSITVFKDISILKNELALQQTTAHIYENLLNAMPDVLFLLDDEGNYVGVKANDSSVLYVEPTMFLHKNFRDIMPAATVKLIETAFKQLRETGKATPFEYDLSINDKERFFECRFFKIDASLYGALVRDITEAHDVLKKLEEREHLYDSVLNNLQGGTYRTLADDSWTALYISRWFGIKFGYDISEFVYPNSRNRFELVHPEDFLKVDQAIRQAVADDKAWEFEYRVRDIHGQYHWVLDKGQTIKDKDGKPIFRDGIILDITDRKKSEEKLKEQENIISSFYDNSPLMMGIIELFENRSDDFLVVRGNKLAARFLGLDSKEIINTKASDIGISQEIYELWHSKYKESEKYEEGLAFESEHQLGEKTYILACTAKFLGKFHNNKKLYAFTAQDVTNERLMQRRLSDSEGKLRAIAENIQEVFYMYNLVENQYEFISPNVEKVIGVPIEFFYSGQTYVERYALPEHRGWKEEALKVMNTGQHYTVEYQVYFYDDVKWLREKCYPILDGTGKLIKISGVCVDITKEKTAELALKRQQDMQALLTQLASEFINIPSDSIHFAVEHALERLANLLGAQRGFIFRYLPDNELIQCVYEWVEAGIKSIRDTNELIPAYHIASWHHKHSQKKDHFIPDTRQVKNKFNREAFERNGVKSVFTLPYFDGDHCEGFIGFDWLIQEAGISDQERTTLTLFARMYENLLQRQNTEKKLHETKASLERISKLAKVGGFEVNMNTGKMEWSQMTYDIYGVNPDIPIDETLVLSHYKEGEHRDKLLKFIEKLNEEGVGYDDEFLIYGPNGTEKWVRTIATPIFENGQLTRVFGTVQDIDYLKRTKEKLEATRMQMESILNEMDDVIISIDYSNNNIIFTTPSINKLLEADDLHLQLTIPDMHLLFHPEDKHLIQEIAEDLAKYGASEKIYRITPQTGKIKWVKNKVKLIYNEKGKPERIDSHVVDITKQKEYEDQLQVQAEILENIGEAVIAANQAGQIIYTNKAARDIFGIKHENNKSNNIADYIKTESNTPVNLQNWADLNQVYSFEQLISTEQGKVSSLLVSISPFKKSTGTLKGFICIATDITTLEQKQKQLTESEEQAKKLAKRYKDIIDNESIYVVKLDADGRYTFVNDHFKKIYGFTNKILEEHVFETVIEEDLPKLMNTFKICFDSPETPHEVILRKPDEYGNILYSKWEFKGIRDGESLKVEEILGVGFDITEQIQSLKKAEHLLNLSSEQNFKLKSFAYIVSHNIRSHSANMTSIVEFLSEASTQEEADVFINMLKSSTKQLDETIHNLNEIITINENVSKPKEKKYLRREIENTLEILSGLIIKEDVEIVNRVSPDEHIYVIASYLDSILLNLISNAIKYRSPKRKPMIELSSYDEGNYKVLEVKDNGLGLDLKKYGSKVFGMYKTFHGNEDARGFGLYITKTQIEAMGGKITLASEPDKGSTFKVYFYDSGE